MIKEQLTLILSIGFILLFTVVVFLDTPTVYAVIETTSLWVRQWFGRYYLVLGLFCTLFIVVIALSPLGSKKLGPSDSQPEFSNWAWIAMLYSTGMGAGILLRAVQEPVFMFQNPPIAVNTPAKTLALEYTFYQWGFTAWAFYGLFAMIIGYFIYNKLKPSLTSSVIEDSIGFKPAHKTVDILVIVTTIFGLIGALSLGTTQINGGLNHLLEGDLGIGSTIFLTTAICLMAFLSVWKGIDKGIKMISKINISITIALLLFVLFQSNIWQVLSQLVSTSYRYIIDFIPMSLAIGDYNPGETFLTDWTYYYWAFWLAWAPFTGIFIARISKGRTLRELLIGVLIVPSLGTFIWFTAFGDAAFEQIAEWGAYNAEFDNVFSSIFVFFEGYPLAALTNSVIVLLLIGFLVTSIDSAIYVLSMFTDKGKQQPKKSHRLIWAVFILLASIALLLLGNSRPEINVLVALQKLLIITSLPFSFLLLLMTGIFVKKLISDKS